MGRAVHGDLLVGGAIVDDPVVARVSEQTVDLNVHGGPWVVQRTIDLSAGAGFEVVSGATLPLPMDLLDGETDIEREALAYLPWARTEQAVRALLAQPLAWSRLFDEPVDRAAMRRALTDRSLHWMLNLPRVAIVGPANVGKSTLANQLFGTERSITADIPGTTRDWVGEIANLDGLAIMLLDTPGVRDSDDAIEIEAIGRSQTEIRQADLVVIVGEAERWNDPHLGTLLASHPAAIRVCNKIDRLRIAGMDDVISTNALAGDGIDILRAAIRSRFDCEPIKLTSPRCWTDRQRRLLATVAGCPGT